MSIKLNNESKYDIFNFLNENIVENGKVHTHTSMHNPKASYFIKSSDLDIFYDLYEESILNGIELHITEKRQDFFPMTIDLDFKYELETIERNHNESHIKKIIDLYTYEISNILNIDKDDKKLTSFIFERDESYKAKGITKDGIHILFPFVITYPSVQYYIRDNILKKFGDIISGMGLKNLIPDIIDRSVISPNTLWLLYGSNKDKPKGNPYKLKYIYDGNSNTLSIEDYFGEQNINLAKFFSIRDKKDYEIIDIRDDKKHLIENTNKKKVWKKVISNIDYDINNIKKYVDILNDERSDNYNQWLELGWALHNIDPNSQELLSVWIEFSKKSSKFKEGKCEEIWEKSKSEGLTFGTIKYWAEIDNKKKYEEIKDMDISKFIDISIKTQSNYDIAFVLFIMYENNFVYCDNDWYIHKNHVWNRENDGMSLRQKISNDELCRRYVKIMSYYNKVASGQILINNQELTEEEKEEYKKKNVVVLEVIKKLKTTSFKENIMKECKELFYNKDFVKKLDSNFYLIGFSNGIYDLKKGELRDGRPEDYVGMSTEIDKIDFDKNHEQWFELENFINTVFFEEDVRYYFLTYFASCLQGHNAEEKFRIWTGTGCHALDTDIMMFNGTTKKVQDIIIGDKIMGDDSTERNVLELKDGYSDMYEFTDLKGDKFTVNGDHILCLKSITIGKLYNYVKGNMVILYWQEKNKNGIPVNKVKRFSYKNDNIQLYKKNIIYYENSIDAETAAIKFKESIFYNEKYIKDGDIIEIKVKDYLSIRKKIGIKNYFLYKNSIEFENKELPLDPYMIGYWLGDKTSQLTEITTIDKEIVNYFDENSIKTNLNIEENIEIYNNSLKNKLYDNLFNETLKKLDLSSNKHIPYIYKINSKVNRLKILAGIIDSDGKYKKNSNQYEITLKSEKIIDDILYVARSLGYSCTKGNITKKYKEITDNYFKIIIYGEGLDDIPVLIECKKATKINKVKNSSYYEFTIEKVKDNYFYGFELDGNHRYLMGDFTVTHNSNGKSKILELFVHCLGMYSIKFPITMLTGKRAASNACTPEIVQSKGKRFGYFEEPSENERINAGLLKEFTGGDKIKARGLHKEPIEFKPQFKLALLCNETPEVPPNDNGTWRRLEVIEFKSRFCENPKESHEFPIDKYLSEKLKNWKELFMALLLDVYYEKYKKNGIKVPIEVIKFTLEYQKQCDLYTDFISDNLDETKENSDIIDFTHLYDEFKIWFEDTFSNHRYPSKIEFKKYLKKKYGTKRIFTTEIKGFKFKFKYEKKSNDIQIMQGY
jgi:P4 family phage/plasmid primase-like protien